MQSLLFDLFKAFDYIKRSDKSEFFPLHACAACSELPSVSEYYGLNRVVPVIRFSHSTVLLQLNCRYFRFNENILYFAQGVRHNFEC